MKAELPRPVADGFTDDWCDAIAALDGRDIPADVLDTTQHFLLDTLGVLAGARTAPALDLVAARYQRWEPTGSATALLTGARMSPPSAALLNATAAHALDFDDQHDPARVHTQCVLLPVLLAIAQERGALGRPVSGVEFLQALAVGMELNARLGLACHESLAHGWHPTMVFGTLSGALAGGRLLGLDARRLAHALGIALHQASGSAQSARDGVMAKRVGAGFAARSAVTSAFLAADGLTGTHRTLEGTAGLFALYERQQVEPDLLTRELWHHWRVREYSMKPYPCCRCKHGSMDLAAALHDEGVRPGDVARAEIFLGALNHLTVGLPYDAARNDVVAAQFSVAYGFAVALERGGAGLADYRAPRITDPALVAMTARTEVLCDPAMDANAIEPSRVRVHLHSGEVLERSGQQIKGSPQRPLSARELHAKFEDCLIAGFGASPAQAERLRTAVMGLQSSPDAARDLVDAFPVFGR